MQKPFNSSFEEQLRNKAENFSLQPSSKVWEGVSSQLQEDLIAGGSSLSVVTSSSFLSNWMLNILIPAVVLVGSGTVFYYNANKNTVDGGIGINGNFSQVKDLSKNKIEVTSLENKNDLAKQSEESLELNNTLANSQNTNSRLTNAHENAITVDGVNAIDQSFGFSKTIGKRSKISNIDSESSVNISGDVIFSKADLEKIAKKEIEHESMNEIKERNIKHFDF